MLAAGTQGLEWQCRHFNERPVLAQSADYGHVATSTTIQIENSNLSAFPTLTKRKVPPIRMAAFGKSG